MKPINEADIQSAILDYLATTGLTFWRCSLGGVRHSGVWKKNPMKGFPDIGVILPGGRLCGIEVKRPGGTMRPEQVAWRETLTKAGAAHCTATSVEDVRVFLAQEWPREDMALDYQKSDAGKRQAIDPGHAIGFKFRGSDAS